MTTRDVLRTMLRRWPVLFLGFVLTAVLLVWVHARPGVYSTVTDVYLVPPSGQNVSRQVGGYSASLISLAGVVEARVNARSQVVEPTSPEVTITSMGIYDGSTVVLPNSGTQFVQQFDSPVLRVRASGPTVQVTAAPCARVTSPAAVTGTVCPPDDTHCHAPDCWYRSEPPVSASRYGVRRRRSPTDGRGRRRWPRGCRRGSRRGPADRR